MAGPAFLFGLQAMGVEVPEWLSAQDSRWLSGGYQESQVEKHATVEGFASGKLQKALDVAVGNHIPAKAGALLGNAASQRAFIEASNVLFAWRCYPTYYGSKRIYIPEANALARTAMKGRSDTLEALGSFGEDLAAFAERHRGISFKVVIPDISECSAANPSLALVSDAVSTEECADVLLETTSSASNVGVTSVRFDDVDSYYEKYYTGDHHWNGFGAWEAFAAASGGVVADATVQGLSSIHMNGSLAREGLLLVNESAKEPLYDIEGIVVSEGPVPTLLMLGGVSQLMAEPNEAEFNFYHSWYGDPAPLQINGGVWLVAGALRLVRGGISVAGGRSLRGNDGVPGYAYQSSRSRNLGGARGDGIRHGLHRGPRSRLYLAGRTLPLLFRWKNPRGLLRVWSGEIKDGVPCEVAFCYAFFSSELTPVVRITKEKNL